MRTFNRNLKRWLLALSVSSLVASAQSLPPEVLDAIEPAVLAGQRPRIAVLAQEDIFGLREEPELDADLVMFGFDLNNLSTAQLAVLSRWSHSGANALFLQNEDIVEYATLFGLDAYSRLGLLEGGTIFEPIVYDCRQVAFGDLWDHFYRYSYFLELPADAHRVVLDYNGKAVCGSFTAGQSVVFFCNTMQGVDGQRCTLNYWLWLLDLAVPKPIEAAPTLEPVRPRGPSQYTPSYFQY